MRTKRNLYNLFALFIAMSLLVSACGTLPQTNSQVRAEQAAAQEAQVEATEAPAEAPTANFEPPATAQGSKPTVEFEPKPLGSETDTTEWEYAAQFMAGCKPEYHGIYLNRLDALYVYPDNPMRALDGATLQTSDDEVILFWTGNYRDPDPTHNGNIIKFCVEGDTGIWLLPPNSKERIPTGLAYVRLHNWNGETEPRDGKPATVTGDIQAEACHNGKLIVSQIQEHMGTEELFALLDDNVNLNPDARFAWGWDALIHATAGKTLVWTRTGEIGSGWAEITHADGKSLYVAYRTGKLNVHHPFSGVQLCNAYPGFDNLTEVKATGWSNTESVQSMDNNEFADIVTNHRNGDLFEVLGLLPSVVYERGTHETKWNTFIVTSAGVTDPNLVKITELETPGGYRVLYFVSTDSVTEFPADWAVISVQDAFSPADVFDWWGK